MKILISQSATPKPSTALENLAASLYELSNSIPALKRLKLTGKVKSAKNIGFGFVLETERKTMPNKEDRDYLERNFKDLLFISGKNTILLSVLNQRSLAATIKQFQEPTIQKTKAQKQVTRKVVKQSATSSVLAKSKSSFNKTLDRVLGETLKTHDLESFQIDEVSYPQQTSVVGESTISIKLTYTISRK